MKFLFQKGHATSEETRRRISEANKGRKFSKKHRKNLSISHKGHMTSAETRAKMSLAHKGRKPSEKTIAGGIRYRSGRCTSEETKKKQSDAHKGERNYLYGKHRSDDVKKKISDANKGENHGMYGVKGEGSPLWKGGQKMTNARNHNKRNRELGFTPLNEWEANILGFEGHHMDKEHVMYIPYKLHKNIYHRQDNPNSMDRINEAVVNWYVNYYGLE